MAEGGESKLGTAYVAIRAKLDDLTKDLKAAQEDIKRDLGGVADAVLLKVAALMGGEG